MVALVTVRQNDSDGAVGPDVEKNHPKPGVKSKDETEEKLQPEKKLTVLETHGYTLGKTIGTGSYATVKVARSERHDCLVAVKIVSKFQAPADYLKKFLPREIEVVKGLKHINLIRFLQAIETTHRVYIIMEYAENGSLLDVIRKDQYIDEVRARKYFRQLIDAVDYCHERGVVHRDIKCENLLMDHDNNVKLSDFGFARGHMRIKNGVAPLSDTFCGSYAYASPEILKGVPYQPQLSDIWSTGVVLYAIVYGRLPFDDTNYNQLLKQVQSKISFPKEPKISANCKSLITKILAPVKFRLKIPAIRSDPWFVQGPSDSSANGPQGSEDTIPSTRSDRSSSDGTPVQLVTKEALKANSSKPDKVRSSTEEYPLETTGPRTRSNSRVTD
ncbi:cAMP-dependent protein kinase catalytic subunit, putative [Pediculus humanus corporis]|uniref:cAMP-dependent protein kinase catalytic subunit, putative n=1 Tax=Pediculus humanus subsp. corporis TaxID=121224 RepID=E0VRV9_PEDHC|nr:cAMP-dependent protein kinase catalytic subunit, putative [Pediculus humanus corporis]EEB16115.1 cAMP-dependent protein kinase catalytic subunit, putative [Pediculus humanus corporis]